MPNQTKAPTSTAQQSKEALVIAFQNFNGVFLAKISNKKDKETFAYGKTKGLAEQNAIRNYNQKYNTLYFAL